MKLTVTQKILTVQETGKNKKTKLNHQQAYKIPLKNSFETLFIEEFQTDRKLLMRTTQCFLHLIMLLVKEDRKSSQLNTANNQRLALLTSNMKDPPNRGKQI